MRPVSLPVGPMLGPFTGHLPSSRVNTWHPWKEVGCTYGLLTCGIREIPGIWGEFMDPGEPVESARAHGPRESRETQAIMEGRPSVRTSTSLFTSK